MNHKRKQENIAVIFMWTFGLCLKILLNKGDQTNTSKMKSQTS